MFSFLTFPYGSESVSSFPVSFTPQGPLLEATIFQRNSLMGVNLLATDIRVRTHTLCLRGQWEILPPDIVLGWAGGEMLSVNFRVEGPIIRSMPSQAAGIS